MSMRPNPERARLLRQRGYNMAEITEAMNEEGRYVHVAEVTAWCNYATPPKLYDYEGQRMTLGQIAKAARVDRWLLESRVKAGMSIADAITRPAKTHAEAARMSNSPWRTHASCGGGSR